MPALVRHVLNIRFLVVCIGITALFSLYLGFLPLRSNCNQIETNNAEPMKADKEKQEGVKQTTHTAEHGHKLAVIVPYRDRFEELLEFVPHMKKFLHEQGVANKIFIINQADNLRFNRASLVNIGYLESEFECDYIAMHDVDLLPLNPRLNYSYPESGPYHVAAPHLHPLYHYPTFVGGILLIRGDHFKQVNGLSNKYWGWGKEDDEFYVRMRQADLKIYSPGRIGSGPADTFKHLHDGQKRKRDRKRYLDQKKIGRQRDYVTGIDTIQYKVQNKYTIRIEDSEALIINVQLECNMVETPWCIHQ